MTLPRFRLGQAEWTIAALVTALAFAVVAWSPSVRTIDPDTPSYVAFADWRTAGYPAILDLVEWATGSIFHVVALQLGIYAGTVAFALLVIWHVTRSIPAVLIALVGIAANPYIHYFHFKIMTDSFFVSCTLLIGVFAMLAFEERKAVWLAWMGAIVGIATAMRPGSIAFLPMIAILVVALRPGGLRAWLRYVAAALAPFLTVMAVEATIYRNVHDQARMSVAARHFFAKAMMLPNAPDLAGRDGTLAREAHAAFAPARALVEATPAPFAVRWFLATRYEIDAQWRHFDRVAPGDRYDHEQAGRMLAVATAGLRANLAGYAWMTLDHYRSLWWVPESPSRYEAGRVAAILADPRLPFRGSVDLSYNQSPSRHWWIGRAIVVLAFATTVSAILLALVASLWPTLVRPSPALMAAGILSLGIHGHQLLVAMTAVAIARYTNGVIPASVMTGALLFAHFWPGVAAFLRRRPAAA